MKADFKKYLMGLLKLKHPHPDPFTGQPSMSEALKCEECGLQIAKAQDIYNRMVKERPEDFGYKKPEFQPSPELEKVYETLIDRMRKDPLYKRHIEKMAYGTEEEKDEEIKKSNEGYYREHYGTKDGFIRKEKKQEDANIKPKQNS